MPRIGFASDWTDLVFHVLAHVPQSPVPAALHDPTYCNWAAAWLGPVDARALSDDARALAAWLADATVCAAVQPLAVLFTDVAQAQRSAARELDTLGAADVAHVAALSASCVAGVPAELLRCSALLEADSHARLPPACVDLAELGAALSEVERCAPRLRVCELRLSRALMHHGRAYDETLYVGAPDAGLRVDAARVAMQAAHEATVLEVGDLAGSSVHPLGERAVEAVAVVVLAQRARSAGLAWPHATWARQWAVGPEHTELEHLDPAALELAQHLLSNTTPASRAPGR